MCYSFFFFFHVYSFFSNPQSLHGNKPGKHKIQILVWVPKPEWKPHFQKLSLVFDLSMLLADVWLVLDFPIILESSISSPTFPPSPLPPLSPPLFFLSALTPSFLQEILMKLLLSTRHCDPYWEYNCGHTDRVDTVTVLLLCSRSSLSYACRPFPRSLGICYGLDIRCPPKAHV